MKLLLFLTTLFCLFGPGTYAQSINENFTHEAAILVENDYPFMTDQYYTAGQDLYYRTLINSKIPILHNSDSSKTIFSFHYGNKVFTPKNVDTSDPRQMDMPYCGWNFISADLLNFGKKNSGNSFTFQIGLVGEESGMGQVQRWLHREIGLYSIYGWDSQIRNEVVVNANFIHTQSVQLKKHLDLISSSEAWLGTGSNKVSEEITLRFLRFNSLNQSTFMHANITRGEYSSAKREFFFFASVQATYVISNIFIQGSLFNHSSPLTLELKRGLLAEKFGVQYSGKRISASFWTTHLSKETTIQETPQDYASISLAYRF